MTDETGTDQKNAICIDVGSNPKLKDFYTRLPDGEESTVEITFIKTGMSGDKVHGSVKEMAPDGMAEEAEKSAPVDGKPGGAVEPNGEEPVMVLVGGKSAGY